MLLSACLIMRSTLTGQVLLVVTESNDAHLMLTCCLSVYRHSEVMRHFVISIHDTFVTVYVQTVARELATAQGKRATAGSELRQIASQAEQDSQELRQARMLIARLQAQTTSEAEHESQQLKLAQHDLSQARLELDRAVHEMGIVQSQLSSAQQTAQRAQVHKFTIQHLY